MRGVSASVAHRMAEVGMDLNDFFTLGVGEVSSALGLRGAAAIQQMYRDEAMARARSEMAFVEAHNIRTVSMLDDDFPPALLEIEKTPLLLYALGPAPLDSPHLLSIVGTRKCTQYGASFVRKLVEDLAVYFPDLVVVSGLAFGIDREAHEAALAAGLKTIAVVAHGLDMVYPAQHRDLAARIVRGGGAIVSEYASGTRPYRGRFLERNRIVATLPPGVVVVESDLRGGAMSTANTAHSYSREVMALPGRLTDEVSRGCNRLIRTHKAALVTGAPDVMETMSWQPEGMQLDLKQRNLFPELDGDTRRVYELLRFEQHPMPVDVIHRRLGIPVHALSSLLGEMEFDALVVRHPGNRFSVGM